MTIQRRSDYGLPPQTPPPSATTVRMVPLTQGLQGHFPVSNLPPGSSTSLLNFIPYNGVLTPRSRLSSLKTQADFPHSGGGVSGTIYGMQEFYHSAVGIDTALLWAVASGSATTDNVFAFNPSTYSISQASFVSSGGMGTKPDWALASGVKVGFAAYPSVFDTAVADDLVVFTLPKPVGSEQTILVAGLTLTGPIYSYLTQAPRAKFIAAYDNYVVAWSIKGENRRVQWSDRGNPGNWTPGGASVSGFEDLLSMQGVATGIAVLDNRLILFSSHEIWIGLPSTYPSQFQFYPLDTTVGCPVDGHNTIVNTELGLVFFGTDRNLRLIPRGGGLSQIINPDIGTYFREQQAITSPWAVYESDRRLYHLYPFITGAGPIGIVVNLNTGEWGAESDIFGLLSGGFSPTVRRSFVGTASELYSLNSVLGTDTGPLEFRSVVTSIFQSLPIGQDLPEGRRQLTGLDLTYKATSTASGVVKASGDFGNTFPTSGSTVTLTTAKRGGVVDIDLMQDGPAPVIEWSSTNTGYELHRLSATFNLRGTV